MIRPVSGNIYELAIPPLDSDSLSVLKKMKVANVNNGNYNNADDNRIIITLRISYLDMRRGISIQNTPVPRVSYQFVFFFFYLIFFSYLLLDPH